MSLFDRFRTEQIWTEREFFNERNCFQLDAKPENLACYRLSFVILFIHSNKGHLNGFICVVFVIRTIYNCRWFSLTWSTAMFFNENKRKRLHNNRVKFPEDLVGAPTWPPFVCLGAPTWRSWRHVKTENWYDNPSLQEESKIPENDEIVE